MSQQGDWLRAPASTPELAQCEPTSASQISRDQRRLREVGYLTAHRRGAEVRYHLELSTLRRLGTDYFSIHRV